MGNVADSLEKDMWDSLIVPLIIATAVYLYLPRPERRLLVLLQADSNSFRISELQSIGTIKNVFQVIQNVDGHMEKVDVESKLNYNYILVSTHLKKEEELEFKQTLEKLEMTKKMEVVAYRTNPVRMILLNYWLQLKGLIFSSSLTPTSEYQFDGLENICSGDGGEDGAKVMVNIIKIDEEKGEALEQYNNKVVFELFPKIGTFIFDLGKVESGYWSKVALMEYRGVEELCVMVQSVEYIEVVKHKQEDLVDTHTYLTTQLI